MANKEMAKLGKNVQFTLNPDEIILPRTSDIDSISYREDIINRKEQKEKELRKVQTKIQKYSFVRDTAYSLCVASGLSTALTLSTISFPIIPQYAPLWTLGIVGTLGGTISLQRNNSNLKKQDKLNSDIRALNEMIKEFEENPLEEKVKKIGGLNGR